MAGPGATLDAPDFYPWAAPNPGMETWFDALPVPEQWRLVDEFLAEGEAGEPAELDLEAFFARMKAKYQSDEL